MQKQSSQSVVIVFKIEGEKLKFLRSMNFAKDYEIGIEAELFQICDKYFCKILNLNEFQIFYFNFKNWSKNYQYEHIFFLERESNWTGKVCGGKSKSKWTYIFLVFK